LHQTREANKENGTFCRYTTVVYQCYHGNVSILCLGRAYAIKFMPFVLCIRNNHCRFCINRSNGCIILNCIAYVTRVVSAQIASPDAERYASGVPSICQSGFDYCYPVT